MCFRYYAHVSHWCGTAGHQPRAISKKTGTQSLAPSHLEAASPPKSQDTKPPSKRATTKERSMCFEHYAHVFHEVWDCWTPAPDNSRTILAHKPWLLRTSKPPAHQSCKTPGHHPVKLQPKSASCFSHVVHMCSSDLRLRGANPRKFQKP